MKDIDFDELNKAVNSLMGGVKIQTERPEAKTLTLTTTLKEGELPKYDRIQHAAEKIGSETLLSPTENTAILSGTLEDNVNVLSLSDTPLEPLTLKEVIDAPVLVEASPQTTLGSEPIKKPAAPSTAKAPSGRFMDVMHPSSDMKTTAITGPAATTHAQDSTLKTPSVPTIVVPTRAATSHEAKTIVPTIAPDAVVTPPELPTEPAVETVTLAPEVVVPEHTTEETDAPIIVGNTFETKESSREEPAADPSIEPALETLTPVVAEVNEPVEPLTSPFLPDAKVEKRPLGGSTDAASFDETDPASLDSQYAMNNAHDTQLTPSEANEPPLPAELHGDLLAIETNLAEISAEQPNSEVVAPEQNVVRSELTHSDAVKANDEQDIDTLESGAIFDTTDYHKTVSHPAKHTPEWVWIAVIVGIIVICAAGAAAFYLLGSQ